MLKLRANLQPWRAGVQFLACTETHYALPLIMEEDKQTIGIEPTFSLGNQETQLLMDDLWNCGFRPSEGSGSAGALAATQRHLDDMRKLVFEEKDGKK